MWERRLDQPLEAGAVPLDPLGHRGEQGELDRRGIHTRVPELIQRRLGGLTREAPSEPRFT